jgi:hypothetical protein
MKDEGWRMEDGGWRISPLAQIVTRGYDGRKELEVRS